MTGSLTVTDVKSHLIHIDDHSIPYTVFIDRVTAMPENNYVTTRIITRLEGSA